MMARTVLHNSELQEFNPRVGHFACTRSCRNQAFTLKTLGQAFLSVMADLTATQELIARSQSEPFAPRGMKA